VHHFSSSVRPELLEEEVEEKGVEEEGEEEDSLAGARSGRRRIHLVVADTPATPRSLKGEKEQRWGTPKRGMAMRGVRVGGGARVCVCRMQQKGD
jgi:hypothetical protein